MLSSRMEVVRNVTRHKLRSFLTISGIVIGVLALTTMGALAENFNALLDGGVTYYGGSIQVGAPEGQAAALLPLTKIDEIKQVEGVKAAFPTYGFSAKPGQVSTVNFGIPDTIVAGDPTEAAWSSLKTTYAQGHPIDADSSGEVVLGSTISKEFKKTIGDTIDLPVKPADAKADFVNHPFKVVGILNVTRTAPDSFAYINITDGQMLLRDSLPTAVRDAIDVTQITEGIDVYAKPGTSLNELDKIADRINGQVTDVKAIKPSQLVDSFKSGGAIFTAITTAAALLALIIGGLSVVNTMFMAVAERVREIGLKKAVGATTFNIMGEFLIEATFIGVVGGVIGYGLGALITIIANASTPPGQSTLFLITPNLTILAIGFAAVLGAVAGVLPAWRASRLDPVIALRQE
jgi:putative ABC transport system permease protein